MRTARGLLTRLGYSHGWRTAEGMRDAVAWDDVREWRIAGGRLHRLQGLVRFEPVEVERAAPVLAEAIWKDSYEAEQHVLHLGQADAPVCWTLAGFASGYLSRVTGRAVYCVEETCAGKGDAVCHMVGRAEEDWDPAELEAHRIYYERDWLDRSLGELRAALRDTETELRQRRRLLGEDADAVTGSGLVTRSEAMRRVRDLGQRVAMVDSNVLIAGESGVGKERVARLIHDASERVGGPFLAINCGALPAALLESELFGHVRGAFTGATSDRPGLFEAANGGTLLLDEVGELPLELQSALLRVLQEREVRRVGENRHRAIDVRVLAATHRDLRAAVRAGRFREDLYYRLRVIEIEVPPLRDRPDDIIPLARAKLVETAARYDRDVRHLSPEAVRRLLAHRWPGNVRELQNVIERAVVLADGDTLDAACLPDLALDAELRSSEGTLGHPAHTMADIERAHVLGVLEAVGQNRAEAARRLGIGPATLYRRLKVWGIT